MQWAARLAADQDEVLAKRSVPCICPRQFETNPPIGVTQSATQSRDAVIERLRCSGCSRRWTRVNAR